jgi:hypothetical protein
VVTETKWGIVFNAIGSYFNVIHKFRKSNGGAGGTSMFIRKNLNFLEINDYIDQNIECICVKIFNKNKEYVVLGLYNPPNANLPLEMLKSLRRSYNNCIIAGDLNCRTTVIGCKITNKNGELLENLLTSTDLQVMNNSCPTYHRHNADYMEILDLILCSSPICNTLFDFEVMYNFDMTSDHYPIRVYVRQLEKSTYKHSSENYKPFNYKKANWPSFKAQLNRFEPPENQNIDILNTAITNHLIQSAEKNIPRMKFKGGNSIKLPEYVLDLIKKRKELKKRRRKVV